MDGQLSVEQVGELIVVRLRGQPTEALLRDCQEQVVALVRDAGGGRVLYDVRELEPPPVDVPWVQRALDEALGPVRLRRALVVRTPRVAFLARIAFGEGDYRVFDDDVDAATAWLREGPAGP